MIETKEREINKRGQEEIVGFVLIMIIVAIIFLIFLGIFIRKGSTTNETTSQDVYFFLRSMMKYTTECSISEGGGYANVEELIKECNSNSICTSGDSSCDVAVNTILKLVTVSWPFGPEWQVKGFRFNSTYTRDEEIRSITSAWGGNCSFNIRAAEYPFSAYPGTITNTLRICY